jgi:hypothetical protein
MVAAAADRLMAAMAATLQTEVAVKDLQTRVEERAAAIRAKAEEEVVLLILEIPNPVIPTQAETTQERTKL